MLAFVGKRNKTHHLVFLRPRNSESDSVSSRRSPGRRSTRSKGMESSKMILTSPGCPPRFGMAVKCRPISPAGARRWPVSSNEFIGEGFGTCQLRGKKLCLIVPSCSALQYVCSRRIIWACSDVRRIMHSTFF